MRMEHEQPSGSGNSVVGSFRKISVLLVDDDVVTVESLAETLEHAGYTVASCSNGTEALAMLKILKPAVIVLDIAMPVMDGVTFRKEQRQDPRLLDIPTVVITGTKQDPLLDPDVADVLCKPIAASDLLDTVRRYCSAAR